jgi:hypothetical protein
MMLRFPLHRVLNPQSAWAGLICSRGTVTKTPEKLEVFIDDKRVLVDPGTTVLQVGNILVLLNLGTYIYIINLLVLHSICHHLMLVVPLFLCVSMALIVPSPTDIFLILFSYFLIQTANNARTLRLYLTVNVVC